jgi:hypothetical protein
MSATTTASRLPLLQLYCGTPSLLLHTPATGIHLTPYQATPCEGCTPCQFFPWLQQTEILAELGSLYCNVIRKANHAAERFHLLLDRGWLNGLTDNAGTCVGQLQLFHVLRGL